MIYNQANTEYRNDGTVGDGAIIAAPGVRLTNGDSGRIFGGATFTAGGATLVNTLGGVIKINPEDRFTTAIVVTGSSGADTVVNAGLITGAVSLGGGNDRYVDSDGTETGVDLGDGDDSYRFEGTANQPVATGGAGRDIVVLASTNGQVFGANVIGFEDLVIEGGLNIDGFSGYQSITLPSTTPFVNLVNSSNPLADVALSGALSLAFSTVRAVTGGDGADRLEIGNSSRVGGNVVLGGGNDVLAFTEFNATLALGTIAGTADGGAGTDTLRLSWFRSGDRSFDLAKFAGFERLAVNTDQSAAGSTTRIANAAGFAEVDIESGGTLLLTAGNLGAARVNNLFGGGLTLDATTTIGRYAPSSIFGEPRTDLVQGDPAASVLLSNSGRIIGDALFGVGDDSYYGFGGSVGGTVYGNAGNDNLFGGALTDRFDGGAGADILQGNGGNDTLIGGGGNDTLIGGTQADVLTGGSGADLFEGSYDALNGDRITDLQVGDRIHIGDPQFFAPFFYSRTGSLVSLSGAASIDIGAPNARLAVRENEAGGIDLVAVNRYSGLSDFGGDGHSDILFQNVGGAVSSWTVAGNARADQLQKNSYFANVDARWNVVETFDMNGDGRSDILWRNADGTVAAWQAQGAGFNQSSYLIASPGASWKIAATGDINGDGRDDMLWRNDDGSISAWRSTGAGFDQNSYFRGSVGANWRVAGLADFDGDGRDDILWREAGGAISEWLSTGSGFAENRYFDASVSTSSGWKVAALADFDGDGRDDVFWRNDNGEVSVWQAAAAGGFVKNTFFAKVGSEWSVAQSGDFNADGRADLLWRNTDGAISLWQSNGAAFDQNVLFDRGPAPGWTIQAHDFLI